MSGRRASRILLAATFVGALTLTACSSPSNEGAAAPTSGGSLVIALDRDLPTLDVTNGVIASQPIRLLANALYEPLMTPDVGGTYTTGMAESLTSNDTATEWTLTLPEGVTFSDGSPLTAESVEAHIARLSDPETGSAAVGQAAQITNTTITDDTTAVFTLAAPNADFASLLARAMGMVTTTETVDEFGFPLGAGPYVVDEFTAGDSVTVVRNENYWGEPALLDSITFEIMPDADSRYQSLQSGDVDLIWTEMTSQITQSREDSSLAVHVAPAAVTSMFLNLESPKFADLEVRKALAQAIDRDAVNAVVNLGEGVTVDNPYSLLGDLAPEVDYPEYDEAAAAAVLQDAGLSFELTVENRPDTIQRGTALKDMLDKVGVQVDLVPVESAEFGTTIYSRDYEAADFVTSIFSDPSGGTMVATSTGAYNFNGYANETVDEALAAASGLTDLSARAEYLATASQQMADDLPMLWLTASNAGYIGTAELTGIPDFSDLTLISFDPAQIGWAAE